MTNPLKQRRPASVNLVRMIVLLLCVAIGLTYAARNCPRCGTSNPDNARFCKNCGYEFPQVRPQPQPRPQPLPALRASADPRPGGMAISSTPDGATVTINGAQRGTTPLVLSGLAPGRYTVEIELAGHRPFTTAVTVPALTATLRVFTVPAGAQVTVNDRIVGTAPDTGLVVTGLQPGSHSVTARLPGRLDQSLQVTLTETEPVRAVEIILPLTDGFLSVTSDPRGAQVRINGEAAGQTSLVTPLRPGTYRLELVLDGYNTWRRNASINLGDTTRVSASLSPARVRRWGLLALGLAGAAGGVTGAVLGESAYEQYTAARSPDEAEDLRRKTLIYDWTRNLAGGIGVLSLGAFFVF